MFSVSPHSLRILTVYGSLCSLLMLSATLHSLAETPDEDEIHAALMVDAKQVFEEGITPFVRKYCTSCHGPRPKSGLNLDAALKFVESAWAKNQWKLAMARVKADDMPPDEASDFPTDEERQQFIEWIGKIKYLSPRDPGPFVIRRLSKVEYANTLRDLYEVDPGIADELPDEVFGEGYLNSLSPLQSELFLGIANKVVDDIFAKPGEAPTRIQKRLFGSTPTSEQDYREGARKVAQSLTRDAYRRPASKAELDTLVQVFDLGIQNELDYQQALALMLKGILVSPQFLFITPAGEVESKEAIIPLDSYQLASRLAYLLWMAPPDRKLSSLADQGRLQEPRILRGQVRRMLKDPRSRALFDGFGAQWLGLDKLKNQTFDPDLFPQMTPEMRSAMVEEARLFFASIVDRNDPVVRFVDSNYTYLNATLAELYGLEKSIKGSRMRKVRLKDPNRGGVLGMPGTLATTSFPNRTSPVNRGVWVLEQILGEQIPPPPPDVPPLEEGDAVSVQGLTLRERTLLHQSDPVCANCHEVLDPIGFGLENFDAIGRWRVVDDSGGAIDASGTLMDGQSFNNPLELKQLIARDEKKLARNFAGKLMGYALNRPLEGYDEVVLDKLMEKIAKDDYKVQTIISEIVTSYPFTHRSIQDAVEADSTHL